ncbi:MAG: MBL fold metallo-hydrolase [bacterium]|nr:MBL fold metallo-hydrolase [bacterium]
MIVETVPIGVNETNCYLVAEARGGQGVVIDPGADAEVILERCSALGLSIAKILITHAHWDHIAAVGGVKEKTSAEICCHRKDLPLYNALVEQLLYMGFEGDSAPPVDHFVRDGDEITVGNLRFTVLHTPGHSPGSVSYLTGNSLFCGDVLFEGGGVGRTDLPGGSMSQLRDSITNRIFSLPPETAVYPGHGPATTVGREKSSGIYLF